MLKYPRVVLLAWRSEDGRWEGSKDKKTKRTIKRDKKKVESRNSDTSCIMHRTGRGSSPPPNHVTERPCRGPRWRTRPTRVCRSKASRYMLAVDGMKKSRSARSAAARGLSAIRHDGRRHKQTLIKRFDLEKMYVLFTYSSRFLCAARSHQNEVIYSTISNALRCFQLP